MKKVIFFLLFTGVALGEQYLCVAEHSTGFSYDKVKKEWENTNFRVYRKYVVSEGEETKSYAFKVTEVGKNSPRFFCDNDFSEVGFLSCKSFFGRFAFNRNNGRYLFSYPAGYYNVLPEINEITDESSDTPLLEIGKCSPF